MKITTESGFKCDVKETAINDMRIFDALIQIQSPKVEDVTKAIKTVEILNTLLGEEQKDSLYEHVAKIEGRAKPESVKKELRDIFSKLSENKKK